MRKYEFVLVVKPTVKEADRKKLLEQVKGWLGKVQVTKEEEWGQKALAYPIKKEDAGYYYQWQMEGEPTDGSGLPADFETKVYQNTSVLRHLLIRTK